jgi:hypothetical protein
MTWFLTFFSDLFYILALLALVAGVGLYGLSYFAKLLPVIATYALLMQIGGVVLALGGGYYVADHKGYERRVAEDKAEIERLNAEARAKEEELAQTLKDKTAALRKASNAIKQKQISIVQRIDSGELRFPSSCGVQASSDAGTAGGNPKDGAESERQALKDIAAIAADGDLAVTRLNACIDQYQAVKDKVNVKQ